MTIRLDHPTDPDSFLRWLERPVDVFNSDFGIETRRGVRYPDLIVEPPGQDVHRLASVAPLFLAEIYAGFPQNG